MTNDSYGTPGLLLQWSVLGAGDGGGRGFGPDHHPFAQSQALPRRPLGGHALPACRPEEELTPPSPRTAPPAPRPCPPRPAPASGHGQRHALGRGVLGG